MKNIDKSSDNDLRSMILDHLNELGIDTELMNIEVLPGNKVLLTGEVFSEGERRLIRQALSDDFDIVSIRDELTVAEDLYGDSDNEDGIYDNSDIYDDGADEDMIGTGDIFRSIEDGIPYIPPTDDDYYHDPDTGLPGRGRKRKRRGS